MLTRRKLIKLAPALIAAPAIIGKAHAQMVGVHAPDQYIFRNWFDKCSMWRAKPVSPTLAGAITASGYSDGNTLWSWCYEVPLYYARATDPPVIIPHVHVYDENVIRNFTVPHMPTGAAGGGGSDAEAVIYDSTTQLIYSFWQLAQGRDGYTADTVHVSSVISENPYWGGGADQGWGFSTPARPVDVRAGGCSPAAGLLRNWELELGLRTGAYPKHALVMSANALLITANSGSTPYSATGPGPIFPSISQDAGFEYLGRNQGVSSWPMGQRMMLPGDYNWGALTHPYNKLIAQTLMNYGAFLMDTTGNNNACNIYCEPGVNVQFNGNYYANVWWGGIAEWPGGGNVEFTRMLGALQGVVSVEGWTDADGNSFTPVGFADMNQLSMRGPWTILSGSLGSAAFATGRNFFVAPAGGSPFVIEKPYYQPCAQSSQGWWMNWAHSKGWTVPPYPQLGRAYKLTAYGAGALTARLIAQSPDGSTTIYTGPWLAPGQSTRFTFPNQASTMTLLQVTNPGAGGAIRLEMVGQ